MSSAVCDAGPLTHLWQIHLWIAFRAFDAIHLPEHVVKEIEQHVILEQWKIIVGRTFETHLIASSEIEVAKNLLSLPLQVTDLAVFSLAQQLMPDFVLTDDLTLRRALEEHGHKPMGSVGLLVYAYKAGFLAQDTLDQAIDQLFVHSTLYLSPQFKTYVRKMFDELLKFEKEDI